MDYCSRSDIEDIYGGRNVAKWADKDNDQDAAKIAARIAWSISKASRDIDGALRGTYYHVPLKTAAGEIPFDAVDLCAELAGVLLYESTGIEDLQEGQPVHTLMWHRQNVEKMFKDIRSGDLRLDAI